MDFFKVIAGASLYMLEYRKALFQALIIPFALTFVVNMLQGPGMGGGVQLLLGVVTLMLYTIIAVNAHRILLLGPGAVPRWGFAKWTQRETRFALRFFLLIFGVTVLIMLLAIPFLTAAAASMPLTAVAVLVLFIVASWLIGRYSLIFPAIAVDEDHSFESSWKLTADYQWLMVAVVAIVPVVCALPIVLMQYLEVPYMFVFETIFSAIIMVFEVGALSMVYQLIKDDHIRPSDLQPPSED